MTVDVVVVANGVVEGLDPARDGGVVLQARAGGRVVVAALELGDLDVPRPGGGGTREGEGEGSGVAAVRPDVDVHW